MLGNVFEKNMEFSQHDLQQLDKSFRAQLVNSLSGFKSANLLGSQNKLGQTNLAIISSVFHLGADPALVGFIMRPHSVPRHSLENILATGFYTLNQVNNAIWQAAHQTSARYESDESEFDMVGLTPQYLNGFEAPFVEQCHIKYGVELQSTQTLVNQTELVIGEIKHIYLPNNTLMADGFIDLASVGTVTVSGLDCYSTTTPLSRLSYAKPHQAVKPLDVSGDIIK